MDITEYEQKISHLLKTSRPTEPSGRMSSGETLSQYFDHTFLKAETTAEDIRRLCEQANEFQMRTVCVPPNRIQLAKRCVKKGVGVCTVVAFPLGYTSELQKSEETRLAVEEGADELDMVIPIGLVKDGAYTEVFDHIVAVVQSASNRCVKAILETSALTSEEKIYAGLTAVFAGVHMLKTSTGFGTHGATVEDVSLFRQIAGDRVGVKASGGIRSYEDARRMIDAGADRLGASATVSILREARDK